MLDPQKYIDLTEDELQLKYAQLFQEWQTLLTKGMPTLHYDYTKLIPFKKGSEQQETLSAHVHKESARELDIDLASLLSDMARLAAYYPSGKEDPFFVFFQDALLGAYYRFCHAKQKAWSKPRNILSFICSATVSVLVTIILQLVTSYTNAQLSSNSLILAISIIAVVWAVSNVYTRWQNLRSYRETWTRHSACYGRLRLALSKFLLSPQSDDDYQAFKEETFSILEQNYDQFVSNLSSNGLAKRPDSPAKKEL